MMISAVEKPPTPASRRRRLRVAVVVVSLAAAATGSVLLATSGGSEGPTTTSGLTETLHLPGSPDFALATDNTLWVSTHGGNGNGNLTAAGRLLRINLATGAVAQTVPLSGASSNLVLDSNRVIADPGIAGTSTPGELIAVDAQTGHVLVQRHQQNGGGPMAVGDGALWEIQESPTILQELSPTTLAPIAPPLELSATSYAVHGLAFGGGYVWASEDSAGDVLRINPTTRAITRVHVGGSPIGVVLASGSIWVTDDTDAAVLRLNPRTLREIGRPIPVRSGDTFYLGASDGYVFIANATDGTVTRIDTRTGKIAGTPIRVAPASGANIGSAYAIAPAGAVVWATSPSTDTISRIQPPPRSDGRRSATRRQDVRQRGPNQPSEVRWNVFRRCRCGLLRRQLGCGCRVGACGGCWRCGCGSCWR